MAAGKGKGKATPRPRRGTAATAQTQVTDATGSNEGQSTQHATNHNLAMAPPQDNLAFLDPSLRPNTSDVEGAATSTSTTPPNAVSAATAPPTAANVGPQGQVATTTDVFAPAFPPINPAQFALDLEANPNTTVAELTAQLHALQAQFIRFTAPPSTPGADRMTNNTGRRLVLPTLSEAPGSVPRPRGSAGGGQRGYHLQAAMGLAGPEGDRLYNMILATVRELVHAARIDLSREYRHVSAEDLSRIFASARRIHPYLARFEHDWATAAIVRQYMSSARRYGRRKGYFKPLHHDDNAPGPSRRNFDDMA